MNQDKTSKFIKEIRKKNNLTQKDLADKYNVTYQAVSKWENGKNLPDTLLLKQMSKDFNVSLDDLFEGEYKKTNKNKKYLLYVLIFIIVIISILLIFKLTEENDFQFKTLTTTCKDFNISGSISYNDNKSAIYISNIEYCGGDNKELYKNLECTLYETYNDTKKIISTYHYEGNEILTLEDFLSNVNFIVDNYVKACKEYSLNNLYLLINATDLDNKVISYKVPLELKDECNN